MTKNTRTDAHRPGAIIPAHYDHWNSYSLPTSLGGWPIPAIGVDCAMPIPQFNDKGSVTGYVTPVCPDSGRCCVRSTERHARAEGRAVFGAAGKCGVCGAMFVYGSMFKHTLTGEIVHMGHDCADKYSAMYDLSAWEIENGRIRAAAAKHIARETNARERAAFLDKHPGLEAALELAKTDAPTEYRAARTHAILVDLASKFTHYRSMSDKQVAFALKLADDLRKPVEPKVEEIKAVAPTGKGVEFEGEIVSAKIVESQWGSAWKVTIKVTTDAGSWLAWGTMPSTFYDLFIRDAAESVKFYSEAGERVPSREHDRERAIVQTLKGLRVEVKASLEASRGSERTCEYCLGSGKDHDDDYVKQSDGKYKNIPREVTCSSCKGTGVVGRKSDPSFAFMSRPSMAIAGRYLHPVYKAPKVKKVKAQPEVTE